MEPIPFVPAADAAQPPAHPHPAESDQMTSIAERAKFVRDNSSASEPEPPQPPPPPVQETVPTAVVMAMLGDMKGQMDGVVSLLTDVASQLEWLTTPNAGTSPITRSECRTLLHRVQAILK